MNEESDQPLSVQFLVSQGEPQQKQISLVNFSDERFPSISDCNICSIKFSNLTGFLERKTALSTIPENCFMINNQEEKLAKNLFIR